MQGTVAPGEEETAVVIVTLEIPRGPARPGLGDPAWEQGGDSAVSAAPAAPACTRVLCLR